MDTREYELELPDGSIETYGANSIAENIFAQCDNEGRMFTLLKEIIDHKFDDKSVRKEDAWICRNNRPKERKKTTGGCKLLVSWKDGTRDWVKLSDMKNSFLLETADYAVENRIDDWPCFAWWCPYFIRKRKRIVCGAKTKYWLRTHKHGIRLPKMVEEAHRIDEENGNKDWSKAMDREVTNMMCAYEFSDDDSTLFQSGIQRSQGTGCSIFACH